MLTKAGEARNTNKVAEIKERIKLVVISSKTNNSGEVKRESLEEELTKEFGTNNYELIIVGKGYIIIVDNVQYKVEEDGTIQEGNQLSESDIGNAGDLSKGGQYDGLTEETAYRITCIEDLVEWTNKANNYSNKFIKLEKTLDFQNTSDYKDYKKITTDINGNGTPEALITELTTGIGFKPISDYSGVFDGQNNEIQNIYMNKTGDAGLFTGSKLTVKNLGISGNIISSNSYAGAIIGNGGSGTKLIDCYNKANIYGKNSSGGLIGRIYAGDAGSAYFYNCYNRGNVTADSGYAGGIIGDQTGNTNVFINCYNMGNIKGEVSGGILGLGKRASFINIYNSGKIENTSEYKPAGIGGYIRFGHEFINTKFLNDLTLAVTRYQWSAVYTTSTLPSSSKSEIQSQEFVNELNTYVNNYNEEHKSDEDFVELRNWKYNPGDYPTFE